MTVRHHAKKEGFKVCYLPWTLDPWHWQQTGRAVRQRSLVGRGSGGSGLGVAWLIGDRLMKMTDSGGWDQQMGAGGRKCGEGASHG